MTSVNKYHNSLVKSSSSEGSLFVYGEWSISSYAKKTWSMLPTRQPLAKWEPKVFPMHRMCFEEVLSPIGSVSCRPVSL
ncbi:hypothetical protein ACFX2F_006526 [Malus domestica]